MFSLPDSSGCMPAPSSMRGEIFPSTVTFPEVGDITPATSFRMVDLPLPFGPMMPTHSPLWISKEMSERAVNLLTVFSPKNRAGKNSLNVFWF